MNDYIKSKIKELVALGSINNTDYDNIFDILNDKEALVKKIRENKEKQYYHNLTNNNQLEFKNKLFSYEYTYERFNGFIDVSDFVYNHYCIKKIFLTYNFFTNCGMSSIISLLTSIVLYNNISIDLLYDETYFETIKYLTIVNKKNNKNKMLYIDSIASNFDFNIDNNILKKYIGVIIDTTCFQCFEFNKLINKILLNGIPCFLIRSHTKLDMLATEFSHLGSVSFIFPNEKVMNKELFDKIAQDCKHLIGVYGACVPPNRFPDFMLDKDIMLLNKNRLKKVKNNNEDLFCFLNAKNINAVLPNHKQFCLIYLGNLDYDLSDMKQKIISFCNNLKQIIPVYHAVSFGFDYIALDCYQNFLDGTFKIRVCMSDFPKEYNKVFYKYFYGFLSKI